MNNRKRKIYEYANTFLKFLSYLGGFLYFIVCLIVYTYNLSYCRYFNISLEYVSFSLSNNILLSFFYYLILVLLIAICYFINYFANRLSIINNIIIDKIISFMCSTILTFLVIASSLSFYFRITNDLSVCDFINYLFKDRVGSKLLLFLVLVSLIMTIYGYLLMWIFLFEFSMSKPVNYNYTNETLLNKLSFLSKVENKTKAKLKNFVWRKLAILITSLIISIVLILSYVAYMGYHSAKNNYKFLLISDTINKNDTLIRLYSDNEKNILSPYKIASDSIIIDNRQIIVKPNINISLKKIESKTIELILEPDGTIDEQVLDRFSNSDK